MADYFTNFSLVVPLPSEAAQQYAVDLAERACDFQLADHSVLKDFPVSLRAVLEDWWFETEPDQPSEGWGIWLHSSSGGIDARLRLHPAPPAAFQPCGTRHVRVVA